MRSREDRVVKRAASAGAALGFVLSSGEIPSTPTGSAADPHSPMVFPASPHPTATLRQTKSIPPLQHRLGSQPGQSGGCLAGGALAPAYSRARRRAPYSEQTSD